MILSRYQTFQESTSAELRHAQNKIVELEDELYKLRDLIGQNPSDHIIYKLAFNLGRIDSMLFGLLHASLHPINFTKVMILFDDNQWKDPKSRIRTSLWTIRRQTSPHGIEIETIGQGLGWLMPQSSKDKVKEICDEIKAKNFK